MIAGDAKKSQQYHNYFLQYSTFASERPQVRIWGHQTCFLPRAPANFVTSLVQRAGTDLEKRSNFINSFPTKPPHNFTLHFRSISCILTR